ncbi:MAG TPA: efflux RND transporter periplasmic adaptor subunit [Candidatus Angelobacter sp.]|nr:efflux RND transporter periplasmic adaptor subunit [Candidatus Angelobacter sp.]
MIDQSTTTTKPTGDQPAPHPRSPGRRGHRVWIWIVVLLIFGLVFWWVTRRSDTGTGTADIRRSGGGGPVTATVATVTNGDLGVYLSAIGTVTPVYTDSIVSQVTGQVVAVHYREGQLIHKGDPLLDIYARPFEASLQQAEGTLERDTHVLEQAKMDLARYQAAWARNAIAKQQLDDQEKLVLQEQGTVKTDQGAVDFDRVQLEFCHITAPITGRIGLRLVDPGNVVTASGGTALAVITQLQPITVVFTISEDNLQQVLSQLHTKRWLEVEAQDRAQLKLLAKGKLLTTDNLIDTTTGTIKLRAVFENKNNALFPNQFVNTRLLVNTLHNVNMVDSTAIQHNGAQAYVWVVQNGVAQMRKINTGVTDNNLTQVEELNPGEVVADSSFEKLQNGAKVNIVQQTPGERSPADSPQKSPKEKTSH